MSEKVKVEGRGPGLLYWNKNAGDQMLPIYCPSTGDICRANCPFIEASNTMLKFMCKNPNVVYNIISNFGEKTP